MSSAISVGMECSCLVVFVSVVACFMVSVIVSSKFLISFSSSSFDFVDV